MCKGFVKNCKTNLIIDIVGNYSMADRISFYVSLGLNRTDLYKRRGGA